MQTISEGTKLVFQHVKNIPNNYAIYEVTRIDYLNDKEYIRSIDDRGVLEFDAKRGYLESLIVSTDSIATFNSLDTIIEKQINIIDSTSNKYVYFICKEDFLEMLYTVAIHTQKNNTDIDYTYRKENIFTITTGDIQRKKRYKKIYHLDDNLFTYLK